MSSSAERVGFERDMEGRRKGKGKGKQKKQRRDETREEERRGAEREKGVSIVEYNESVYECANELDVRGRMVGSDLAKRERERERMSLTVT